MKVCIIGTGSQGTGLAGLLAMESDVEKLVLADYSEKPLKNALDLLETLKDKILCKDIQTKIVDASNVDAVVEVIDDVDIVFNGIIPCFNIPIMKACIKKKCHYMDLFANPFEGEGMPYEETIDAQFDLNKEFEEAGILALPSIGVSPGWTSVAAEYLSNKFDEVKDVVIRWADFVDSDIAIAPISPITLFAEWFGSPYPVKNVKGKPVEVDLIKSKEEFEFPEPIGKRDVYTVTAHPDIVLIQRYNNKPINSCEEKGGIYTGGMKMADLWIKFLQCVTSKQGSEKKECNIMEELASNFVSPLEYTKLMKEGKIRNHHVCFSCEVNGMSNGEFVRRICFNLASLEESLKHLPWASPAVYQTAGGLPIELILAIGRKEITDVGVKSVSELNMSDFFIEDLKKRGHQIIERVIK